MSKTYTNGSFNGGGGWGNITSLGKTYTNENFNNGGNWTETTIGGGGDGSTQRFEPVLYPENGTPIKIKYLTAATTPTFTAAAGVPTKYDKYNTSSSSWDTDQSFTDPGIIIDNTQTITKEGTLIVNMATALETYSEVRGKLELQVYIDGVAKLDDTADKSERNIVFDSESHVYSLNHHPGNITKMIPITSSDINKNVKFEVKLTFLTVGGGISGYLAFGSGTGEEGGATGQHQPNSHILPKYVYINAIII